MPARARRSIARVPARAWFPLAIIVASLGLGLAGYSGSSAALHASTTAGEDTVFGRPRSIRFDEFWVRTPLIVRQAELGYPTEDRLGVGVHDMGVLDDLPTADWQTLVRPHQLPYRLLPVEQAFALEWWFVFLALPALATYAFMLGLGARTLVSAATGLIVVLSPVFQWWTVPATGTSIAYACFAGVAVLAATRARSRLRRVAWSVVAGWMGACLVVVLYPPWVIPMAMIVGAASLAVIARELPWRLERRQAIIALATVVAVAGAVAGVLLVAFVVTHREALEAVASSVYPGRRRASGGEGSLQVLLSAPFDIVQARNGSNVVAPNGLNQSEAAVGLFVVAAVVAALVAEPGRVPLRPWRKGIVLTAALATTLLLVAWYILPIPSALGRVLLLDRVTSFRLSLPLAFGSAVVTGLYVTALHRRARGHHWRAVVAGTAVFGAATAWAASRYSLDGLPFAWWPLPVLVVLFTVAVGLTLWRGVVGLAMVVVLLGAGALFVNPLQHGLGPLIDSPAARLGRELRDRPGAGAVIVIANDPNGDTRAVSAMAASGVDYPSGVNLYPNERAWRTLDPDESDRRSWDRFAHALWGAAPDGAEPRVFLNGVDSIIVMVDPCDAKLSRLGVRTVVSYEPIDRWCLDLTDRVTNGDGRLHVYRVDRSRPRATGSPSPGS